MAMRIITVSREFGSGGHTVAQKVADRLGIAYYDKALVEKIAKESGLDEAYVREKSEYASHSNSFLFGLVMNSSSTGGFSVADQIYIAQNNVIKDLAEKERCVILGRCSDYILRDRKDCLNTFIHADKDFRARRIVEQYGERPDSPEKRMKEKDERRKAYYKHYTGRNFGDLQNYHISLDSSVLGIEECVDIIVNAYKNIK
ncbi:MAG: cytidylate kinase-like family protein [Oscillospiraceae bacterium]|jgi:cytidylate kinase|nr:cytidylate kinase-like family protein [Oscillospiraceae bacterium]